MIPLVTVSNAGPEALDPGDSELMLIDTSVWIEALRVKGSPRCKQLVQQAVAANTAAICEIVLAELLQGLRDDAQATQLLRRLQAIRQLSMEGSGAEAARIGRALRAEGKAFALPDLLIGAVASLHHVTLLHRDRHLDEIAKLANISQITVP